MGKSWAMLCRIYVEALLADADVADRVWELWKLGLISDEPAAWAWLLIALDSVERISIEFPYSQQIKSQVSR